MEGVLIRVGRRPWGVVLGDNLEGFVIIDDGVIGDLIVAVGERGQPIGGAAALCVNGDPPRRSGFSGW